MKNFETYARYYDLLYRDKDYEREASYVLELIAQNIETPRYILNLGCGTGMHDAVFRAQGITLDGIDMSSDMLRIARARFPEPSQGEYHLGDIREWSHPSQRKYDAIISLFHVMSYQTSNEDVYRVLETVDRHLTKDGIFIFDYWYGPAVYYLRPENKLKDVEDDTMRILRSTKSDFNEETGCVDVRFEGFVIDKATSKICDSFKEDHKMRCFFERELSALLVGCGFQLVRSYEWLKESVPNREAWSAISICRRK